MTTTSSDHTSTHRLGVDARVVVGIDASRADPIAVRQACALAGPDGTLDIVCVRYGSGQGLMAQATIGHSRAETALEDARLVAREQGIEARPVLIEGGHAARGLLEHARGHDALVVGSHGAGRATGIALGRVASVALHRSTIPVLVARSTEDEAFPEHILFASDGSIASDEACELAAGLASGARVTMVTVGHQLDGDRRQALARQSVDLRDVTGTMPAVVFEDGEPHEAIVELARADNVSLIVVGSGHKKGLRALGSTSERVAHDARCSVLVAR